MKKRYIYPVYDGLYPIVTMLVKASFVKLVTERSKKENSAVVKFWIAKGKLEIKDGVLTYNGKKVSLVITSF